MTTGTPEEVPARRRLPFGFIRRRHDTRESLERLQIRRSRVSNLPLWILGTLLLAAVVLAAVGALMRLLSGEVSVALAAAIITVVGLLVAVLQWRNGLAEKALDTLYQRIDLANRMRLEAFKGVDVEPADSQRPSDTHERKVAHEHHDLYEFFVFTEIDSLEYALRRYRFGLGMNADIMHRAVSHFRGRCDRSDTFADTARACIDTGAYFAETKDVVEAILKKE